MSEYEKYIMKEIERKLIELMGEKEYVKWSCQVAKAAFRKEVENMPEGDFKDFILENIDAITEVPDEE